MLEDIDSTLCCSVNGRNVVSKREDNHLERETRAPSRANGFMPAQPHKNLATPRSSPSVRGNSSRKTSGPFPPRVQFWIGESRQRLQSLQQSSTRSGRNVSEAHEVFIIHDALDHLVAQQQAELHSEDQLAAPASSCVPTHCYDLLLKAYICAFRLANHGTTYPHLAVDAEREEGKLGFDAVLTLQKTMPNHLSPGNATRQWADSVNTMSGIPNEKRRWNIDKPEGIFNIMNLFYQMIFGNVTFETSTLTLFIEALALFNLSDSGESQRLGTLVTTGLPTPPLSPSGLGLKDGIVKRPRGVVQAFSLLQASIARGHPPDSPGMYNTLLQACCQAREPGLALEVLDIMLKRPQPILPEWGSLRSIICETGRIRLWCISSSSEYDWYQVGDLTLDDAAALLPMPMAVLLLLRPLSEDRTQFPEGFTWARRLPDRPGTDPRLIDLRRKLFVLMKKHVMNKQNDVSDDEREQLFRAYVNTSLTLGDVDAATDALGSTLRSIGLDARPKHGATPSLVNHRMIPELVDLYIRGLFFNGDWRTGLRWLEAGIWSALKHTAPVHLQDFRDLVRHVSRILSVLFQHYPSVYSLAGVAQLERIVFLYARATGEPISSDIASALVRHRCFRPHVNESNQLQEDPTLRLKNVFSLLRMTQHEPLDPQALCSTLDMTAAAAHDGHLQHTAEVIHGVVTESLLSRDKGFDVQSTVWARVSRIAPAMVQCVTSAPPECKAWAQIRSTFELLLGLGDKTFAPGVLLPLQQTLFTVYMAARTCSAEPNRLMPSDQKARHLWTWILAGSVQDTLPTPLSSPVLQRAHSALAHYMSFETDRLQALQGLTSPSPLYPLLADTSEPAKEIRQQSNIYPDLNALTIKLPGYPALPLVNYFPSRSICSSMVPSPSEHDPILDQLLAFEGKIRLRQIPSQEIVTRLLSEVHKVSETTHEQCRWAAFLYQAGMWALPHDDTLSIQYEQAFARLEECMIACLVRLGQSDLAVLHWQRLAALQAPVSEATYHLLLNSLPHEASWAPIIHRLFASYLSVAHPRDNHCKRLFLSWFGTDDLIQKQAALCVGSWTETLQEAAMQSALLTGDVEIGRALYRDWETKRRPTASKCFAPMHRAMIELLSSREDSKQEAHQLVLSLLDDDLETDMAFNQLLLRCDELVRWLSYLPSHQGAKRTDAETDHLCAFACMQKLDDARMERLNLDSYEYAADLIRFYGVGRGDLRRAEELYESIPARDERRIPSWEDVNAMMAVYAHHERPAQMVHVFAAALAGGMSPPTDAKAAARVISHVGRLKNRSPEALTFARSIFDSMRPMGTPQQHESEWLEDSMLAYVAGTLRSPATPTACLPRGPWALTMRTPDVFEQMLLAEHAQRDDGGTRSVAVAHQLHHEAQRIVVPGALELTPLPWRVHRVLCVALTHLEMEEDVHDRGQRQTHAGRQDRDRVAALVAQWAPAKPEAYSLEVVGRQLCPTALPS